MSWDKQESMEDIDIKFDLTVKQEPLENVEETNSQETSDRNKILQEFKVEAESETHSQV